MVNKYYPAIQKGLEQGKEMAVKKRAYQANVRHKPAIPRHG